MKEQNSISTAVELGFLMLKNEYETNAKIFNRTFSKRERDKGGRNLIP